MVVDDGLGLLGRGLAAQDARAEARGDGKQADGFQVRVQGAGVSPAAWAALSWAATTSITALSSGQGGDRQCRVGQREREVGRVQDGEGAPLVVGGQPLGQDGGDDVARAGRVLVSLIRLIRARARSLNWAARCCMAASMSSSLVPK